MCLLHCLASTLPHSFRVSVSLLSETLQTNLSNSAKNSALSVSVAHPPQMCPVTPLRAMLQLEFRESKSKPEESHFEQSQSYCRNTGGTRCVLWEVTMYGHLPLTKLGFLPVPLWPLFLLKCSLSNSNLSLDDPNPIKNTQNSPKRTQEKQRFARRKHGNHMQVTDRPRPDAPSLTQTIIVQMVYCFSLQVTVIAFRALLQYLYTGKS